MFFKKAFIVYLVVSPSFLLAHASENDGQQAVPEETQSQSDVDDGISAYDKAVLKRSKAIVQASIANSKASRQGRGQIAEPTASCKSKVNNICITGDDSVIVLPGATVIGDINNVAKGR